MKNLFLVSTATAAVASSTTGLTVDNSVSISEVAEMANNGVLEYSIESMNGKKEFPVRTTDYGIINKQSPIDFNYLEHASSWDNFVQKYPNFKFSKLSLKTYIEGNNKNIDLMNKTFKTADFKSKMSNKQYIIEKTTVWNKTDFVQLTVIGMLREESGQIKFFIQYDLNISQQYGSPYPSFNSETGKIQFFTI